ncbi:MAG: TRAM domain-containing protein [Gemmatimonadaceae bacterium]
MMTTGEVTIDSIAAGGDGVARLDGLVVFLPRTAPGDRGVAQITQRGRLARGSLVRLTSPSPERVEPRCLHYTRDRCGGCQLQHLAYDAQLKAKAQIIRDSLERIAKRMPPPFEVRRSEREWRYRRKLTLAIRRAPGRDDEWIAGLYPFDQPSRVFALDDCPITHPDVLDVWRQVLAARECLPSAGELRASVRVAPDGATFVIEGGTSWPRRDEFVAAVPALASIWWVSARGLRRLVHGTTAAQAPGASFSQVNAEVGDAVRERVLATVLARAPRSVIDAYAGLGHTAMSLESAGVPVTAIELDAAASAWCGSRLAPPSRALTGRVEDLLPQALPADVVVLNPPRAGVDARVTEALENAARTLRAVVYVSCNPATLARDLARLPSFRIAALAAFDMFPQTAHVESVCELEPVAA